MKKDYSVVWEKEGDVLVPYLNLKVRAPHPQVLNAYPSYDPDDPAPGVVTDYGNPLNVCGHTQRGLLNYWGIISFEEFIRNLQIQQLHNSISTPLTEEGLKIMDKLKEEATQEITLPRPNGRPDYVTTVPFGSIKHTSAEETDTALEFGFSVELTDEQWAEYLEVTAEELVALKGRA